MEKQDFDEYKLEVDLGTSEITVEQAVSYTVSEKGISEDHTIEVMNGVCIVSNVLKKREHPTMNGTTQVQNQVQIIGGLDDAVKAIEGVMEALVNQIIVHVDRGSVSPMATMALCMELRGRIERQFERLPDPITQFANTMSLESLFKTMVPPAPKKAHRGTVTDLFNRRHGKEEE